MCRVNRCGRFSRGYVISEKLQDLPIEDEIKVVEDLWDSIAADQEALPLTREQKEELDRRLDAYERDKNPGRPATGAMAEIRRKL
ncbi:MAG: addiction module protein [Candidatus Latescibacteria bacterium]|nr:addiction module protein [Candidatus Latescibacterota bacterium]